MANLLLTCSYLFGGALGFQDGVGVSNELLALYGFLQLGKFRAQLFTKVLPTSCLQKTNVKYISRKS